MSWRSTRTCKVVVGCLLAACAEKPMTPGRGDSPAEPPLAGHPGPPGGAPSTIPDSMRSWFAERGITLPAEMPADPAPKVAQDERLLGDGSGNRRVNYYDLFGLWQYLRGVIWYAANMDLEVLNIDRSPGDPDWFDLALFGDFLYGSGENPHGIGLPLATPPKSFDVEVRFMAGSRFTASQQALFRQAASRWERVITTEDLSDRDYSLWPWESSDRDWWDEYWGTARGNLVRINDKIDDVRVYATTDPALGSVGGIAGALQARGDDGLPIWGVVMINEAVLTERNEKNGVLASLFLHEIAHVLGFGVLWDDQNLLGNSSKEAPWLDTYFRGWRARRAFDEAGGRNYRGRKVPVHQGHDDGHWRESVFDGELMTAIVDLGRREPMSLITIQSLADLGYEVDVSQAEDYTLPPASKPAAQSVAGLRCKVFRPPRDTQTR